MAFGKYILPTIVAWFGYKDKKERKVEELRAQVFKLETNHMVHFNADLLRIEGNMDENFRQVFDRLNKHEADIARLDERSKK